MDVDIVRISCFILGDSCDGDDKMAHVIFGMYAHKATHDKLLSEINNWRYQHVGDARVGASAPLISEVKLYDVRIPEELVPLFLRDVEMIIGNDGSATKHFFTRWLMRSTSLMRKVLGFKNIKPAKGPQQYDLKSSWHRAFLIGVMKDDICKDDITGNKREVL